jgi:hypothetical protein
MDQLTRIESKLDQLIKLLGMLTNREIKPGDDAIADNPAERWGYVAGQPWCQALLLSHCRVNRNNWTIWKSMYDKYGEKLIGLAQILEADKRWPDQVEAYIQRVAKKNTSAALLREMLAACGCDLSQDNFDQWRGILNHNCKSVSQALECVKWVTDAAKKYGKPIRWPADATPWIEQWKAAC